jgi:hypothetical protein
MDELLASLFGAPPDYSNALTPQQTKQMQSNALAQGGIGALVALLGASGPQARPISTGQALAGALGAGYGGYQSSFDNTLKQLLTTGQLGEIQAKTAQRKQLAEAMAITDPQQRIKKLQDIGSFDVIKNMAESQSALRKSGIMRQPGEVEAPSPFAPYLTSTSPEVKTLATQLEQGFRSGVIDEETAYKRIEPLARMQDQFLTRQIAAGERADKAAEGKKPTEGERKAAVLAGRLEGALSDLQGATAKAQTPEYLPSLLQGKIASFIPGSDILSSKLTSSERARAEAAQLDALDAALTLGTGAAYTNEQLRGYAKAYFPQIGNDAATIADKNARFERLVALAREQAGSAASSIDKAREKAKPFDVEAFKKENGLR